MLALLVLSDLFLFFVTTLLTYFIRINESPIVLLYSKTMYLTMLVLFSAFYIFGRYEIKLKARLENMLHVFLSLFSTFLAIVFLNYLFNLDRAGLFGRGVLIGSLSIYGLFAYVTHKGFQKYVVSHFQLDRCYLLTLDAIDWVIQDFKTHKINFEVKKSLSEVKDISTQRVPLVIGMTESQLTHDVENQLIGLKMRGQKIFDLGQFYELKLKKIPVQFVDSKFFIFSQGFRLFNNPVQLRVKRFFDVFLALVILILSSPILLVTAGLIKIESRGPLFYRQIRTGLNGKSFSIIKFRSMSVDAEKESGAKWATLNDSRITNMGRLIRTTRIDEIPQVINVLRGEMSFIGPRPERPEFNKELEKVIPHFNLRHLIRPGITGWAQVLFPYGASVEDSKQKLEYDLYYIKNYSLLLDFKILLLTIRTVFLGRGR